MVARPENKNLPMESKTFYVLYANARNGLPADKKIIQTPGPLLEVTRLSDFNIPLRKIAKDSRYSVKKDADGIPILDAHGRKQYVKRNGTFTSEYNDCE